MQLRLAKSGIILLGSLLLTVTMSLPRIYLMVRLQSEGLFNFDFYDYLVRIMTVFLLSVVFLSINLAKRKVSVFKFSFNLLKVKDIVVFNLLLFVAMQLLLVIIHRTQNDPEIVANRGFIPWVLLINFFIASFAVLIATVYKLLTENHRIKIENSLLEKERSEMKYTYLKDQVNPHFFFNSLYTISGLIQHAPEQAINLVHQMSDMYRYILSNLENDTITLYEEYHFCNHYFAILQGRFGDGIKLFTKLSGEKVWNQKIPPLSVQVLIENAVKHNQFDSANPLNIYIENKNGALIVRNNLRKKLLDTENNHGLGLFNLNQRYQYLSNKEIIINETSDVFSVEIPLLE